MIRWFLIVLMFALPAQFAWAAAAGYCAHEKNPASFHVGHHVHEHLASTADAADSADASDPTEAAKGLVTQGHADCSSCHAVVAQFAAPQAPPFAPPPRDALAASTAIFLGCGIEDSIDRPKWTRTG